MACSTFRGQCLGIKLAQRHLEVLERTRGALEARPIRDDELLERCVECGERLRARGKGRLHARVDGAELVEFEAAHLSNVEAGDAFTQRVLAFLR